MITTERVHDLRQRITADLAALRIYRDLGEHTNVEKLNDRINLELDRLRRLLAPPE